MSKKEREICLFKMDFKKYFHCCSNQVTTDNFLEARSKYGYGQSEACFSKVPKTDQFIDYRQCYTNYFEQFVNSLIIHYLHEGIKLSSSFHKPVSRPLIPLIFCASIFKQAN